MEPKLVKRDPMDELRTWSNAVVVSVLTEIELNAVAGVSRIVPISPNMIDVALHRWINGVITSLGYKSNVELEPLILRGGSLFRALGYIVYCEKGIDPDVVMRTIMGLKHVTAVHLVIGDSDELILRNWMEFVVRQVLSGYMWSDMIKPVEKTDAEYATEKHE